MHEQPERAPILIVLATIALAATAAALALQTYFGRLWPLIAPGQVLAVAGAAMSSTWLRKSTTP